MKNTQTQIRQQIINNLTKALQQYNKGYFLREEDIQLYLYNYLTQTGQYSNTFIEYYVPITMVPQYPKEWGDKSIYIDIVVEKDGLYYPIEIKYKTNTQEINSLSIFGTHNTKIALHHQGAQNIGCYSFWKDIKRLETFETSFKNVQQGIMLFITNDASYTKEPRETSSYKDFSLHAHVVKKGDELKWGEKTQTAVGRPSITVIHKYTITWNNNLGNVPKHKYILI